VIGFNAQANEHHHETMSEAQPQVISATGEVKGIDLESKKITIHHDPIAAVNWPEMTMRFTITPQTKMSEIKTGDKVAFNFVQQGNLSLLQDIKVSQ
ncbi:Cu(+)/Ag(+) efflux RND transporter periplasmic metallochaperone, partial [Escherichia coli]